MARDFAESVSYFCVWIMGVVAGIYFLQSFEAELKPLVLAFLFVSMLEAVVQFLEFLFLKMWVFFKLLFYTMYLVAKLCKRKIVGWCRRCKCDASVRDLKDQLCDCEELLEKWSETLAGKNLVLRIVSVVLTLIMAVGIMLVLEGLFAAEGKDFVDKMKRYRLQLTSMSTWCNVNMGNVADNIPAQYQNVSKAVLKHVQDGFDNLVADLPAKVEEWGVDVIHAVVASSSAFVIGLLFFLLYSAIMLFDPLHINLEKEKRPLVMSTNTEIRRRLGAEVEEGYNAGKAGDLNTVRLNEFQHYIYKIVWNYFFVSFLLNVVFAACVGGLLSWLKVDLVVIISTSCFFLAFIPELGAIISTVLPLPIVLLSPTENCGIRAAGEAVKEDCISDMVYRLWTSLQVIGGIILIKVMVANVLYSLVMGKNKVLAGAVKDDVDEVSNTHGVIVLFAVVFFGKVWGIAGMLISVPVLSVIRLSLNVGKVRTRQRAISLERRESRVTGEKA